MRDKHSRSATLALRPIFTAVRHLILAKNFGLNMDIVDPDAFQWCRGL